MSAALPARESGTPCWFEVGGPADPAVLDFWSTAAGWRFDVNAQVSGYRRGLAGERKVAGFGGPVDPRPPRGWRVYLHVDDLDRALTAAVTGGAEVVHPETAAGPDGRFAFLRDPAGVVTGLFQPYDDPGTAREPGPGRVAAWRLEVADPDAAHRFYGAFLPAFSDQVEVVRGERGWTVVLAAPPGALAGEVVDPAGNSLLLTVGGGTS